MIKHAAVDGFGRAGEAPGGAHVAFARGRVAARMIVGKNDPRASVDGRIADNRAKREFHPCSVSVMMAEVKTVELVVDMGNPQTLEPGVGLGDAAGKECPGRGKALELERKFGTLISHATRLEEFVFANDWN